MLTLRNDGARTCVGEWKSDVVVERVVVAVEECALVAAEVFGGVVWCGVVAGQRESAGSQAGQVEADGGGRKGGKNSGTPPRPA